MSLVVTDTDKTAPMAGRSGVNAMQQLLRELSIQLNRDRISQTASAFNGPDSLCKLDEALADIAARLRNHMEDVYRHLNQIAIYKAEAREDFGAVNQLMSDIDAIQQRLVSLPFDMIEFHKKHENHLKQVNIVLDEPDSTIRKLALSGHKEWLKYQVSYVTEAIISITKLYPLVTGKR